MSPSCSSTVKYDLSSVAGLISRLPGLVSEQEVSATAFAVSVSAVKIFAPNRPDRLRRAHSKHVVRTEREPCHFELHIIKHVHKQTRSVRRRLPPACEMARSRQAPAAATIRDRRPRQPRTAGR